MKTKEMARKMAYIGAGAGLVLFAVLGLLPGSFIGGVIGLNIAGSLFGMPVSSALLPRLIVGLSMLVGVLVSGIIFVAGSTVAGWLIGYIIDALRVGETATAEAKHK
ncbi:MAG TPA: hypothetical protein VEI46_08910 [Thermodesulfovibrionales bacterium]|nr:hypothetical protein [Thermodesulfovibrionales bacterium]